MESLHDRDLLGSDDDNQALSSGEFNFAHGMNCDEVSGHTPASVPASMGMPARKVHSAAASLSGFGGDSVYEEIPRPYTSAGVDSPPKSSNYVTRQRKIKPKKTARNSDVPAEDRPSSADVNEWGDFDTDRLLRDESAFPEDRSNQTSLDALDEQRSKSRRSRRSTPAMASPRPNPWDGYLYLNTESKESSRPAMQVLRQKPIEILNLDLVANHPTARTTTTPKPLLGRASLERLMSTRSRPTTSCASRPATPAPLFGTEIPDTPKNRATIFGRFAALWSLISHRAPASPSEQPSDISPDAAAAQTRSPFECSMTMVKLCKTVGISLTPSAATHLSFWYTNEQGVEFESFCDLVIQGAIQPALHHFNLDNSLDDYVAALDTVVQSLVTTTPARRRTDKPTPPERLKELHEIQPVFMSWKAGITPRLVQPSENPDPPPTRALITAERIRKTLEASASQHMLAHQLPSEEARVTHVENIRRKVQLHKSWKFISDGKIVDRISSPNAQVSRGGASFSQDERNKFADLSDMLERAHSVLPTSTGAAAVEVLIGEEGGRPEVHVDHSEPEKDVTEENDEVLVCCSCSVRGAVLWCSSCFTVNCQKCWQEIHACTVDMSMVSSEPTSTKKPLLGPTALALKKKRCGSATLRPPVAMIYLPTKAIAPGTLARGNSIVRHSNARRQSSNQVASNAMKDEVPVVVASAILPSLHKSRSDGKLLRHHERPQVESSTPTTDSTADLMKSLVLRMSPSTSTTGSHSTGSHTSTESATRLHKHHTASRPNLHLAPVSLDADLLLSSEPDRRR
ncbi:hypothetical protein PR003_g20617 [Phytophthora rubi]|uniref:B box-type domain-containing protein n=1 Tax=Phytophthora rubi TaxID=129364 RepID=A0A6A3JL92_9STRA|nr:hypothetical protein PR002_g20005 [Phytophthora rubi]KAE8997201.1 hypothetical protein PR001_g19648 [Phytophthora rubi]KAE9308984.1 hypothetical protein PR003_g20617 [Phytophthora rubi]